LLVLFAVVIVAIAGRAAGGGGLARKSARSVGSTRNLSVGPLKSLSCPIPVR
jgi:hypothetical protein